jgi:hypothetical protein
MNDTKSPLDAFEERLLGELRTVVAERATGVQAPAGPAPSRRSVVGRRLVIGLAASATLAVGTAAIVPLIGGDQAAYAVERSGDNVTVTIYRFTDADGLERALERNGIAAEVDYLPLGKVCREPRFVPAPIQPSSLRRSIHATGPGRGPWQFTIDRKYVPAGRTLVLTTFTDARPTSEQAPGSIGGISGLKIAEGPVGPCVPVDQFR